MPIERIQLGRRFNVRSHELRDYLRRGFNDQKIEVDFTQPRHLADLIVSYDRRQSPLAVIPVAEHLGGGARPMVQTKDHFSLINPTHKQLDVKKLIIEALSACHTERQPP